MVILAFKKQELFGLSVDELRHIAQEMGMPAFRGRQLADWMYKQHVWDFSAMTDIAKKDAALFAEKCTVLPKDLTVLAEKTSRDKLTSKLLVRLADGNSIETVGMQHGYGYSVCASSQVGCAMGCVFCASTLEGCVRNLTAAEMLSQVALFQKKLAQTGGRVGNIIIMGSGEPLLNYAETVKFMHLVHQPELYNLGYRNITLSTCGIVDGIENLQREDIPINLAISLHAPTDALREQLMPVNKKYKIQDIMSAADNYAKATGRRVTYEYILIKGVNDAPDTAKKLAKLLSGRLAAVNIIPVNPVKAKGWQRPDSRDVADFGMVLQDRGITATIRKEMGSDIRAACGQLKAAHTPGDIF